MTERIDEIRSQLTVEGHRRSITRRHGDPVAAPALARIVVLVREALNLGLTTAEIAMRLQVGSTTLEALTATGPDQHGAASDDDHRPTA
ncbi:hypothetical protein FSW04_01295 [Baekduia soli]|uniref:Uncharacterized protein n=1 Tax=Baekduia soli TaxID=496014 RepID=A0A5B8U045_9ACTN|nr:hypothetical protein [Baekduia soli]QEC46344.1 hypothetical protein FSW04_01295 [Baekduia soli]